MRTILLNADERELALRCCVWTRQTWANLPRDTRAELDELIERLSATTWDDQRRQVVNADASKSALLGKPVTA